MSIHVTDFKWEKGKNDLQYIELLEKTLKNEQAITAKAVAKIRELSKENKENRNKAIDEFAELLKDLIAKNVEDAESSNDLCCEIYQSEIDEIAEEMRGAKDNG